MIAIQICVITAFLLVPRKLLILRFCLIHLKNSSTSIAPGRYRQWCERKMRDIGEKHVVLSGFPVAIANPSELNGAVFSFGPVSSIVWSEVTPFAMRTGSRFTTRVLIPASSG